MEVVCVLLELYVFIGVLLGCGFIYDQYLKNKKITASDVCVGVFLVVGWFPLFLIQLLYAFKNKQ